MAMVVEENPDLFRLWYGDYDGLITNFIHSKRSWVLVFQTLQRHVDGRRFHEAEKVLCTLDEPMKHCREHHYFQLYVTNRIVSDFYRWDKRLSEPMKSLLKEDLLIRGGYLGNVVCNISNFRHFPEKGVMKFLAEWVLYDKKNEHGLATWKVFQNQEEEWIPFGNQPLSLWLVDHHHVLPFPETTMLPEQMHKQVIFHQQDKAVEPLVHHLVTCTRKVVFLFTTEMFLKRSFTDEEAQSYDQGLVDLCRYLEKTFPMLDFVMICLYTNRECKLPHETLPARMIVMVLYTPYVYVCHDNVLPRAYLDSYYAGVSECFRRLRSPDENKMV
jgi:hypothetical protein